MMKLRVDKVKKIIFGYELKINPQLATAHNLEDACLFLTSKHLQEMNDDCRNQIFRSGQIIYFDEGNSGVFDVVLKKAGLVGHIEHVESREEFLEVQWRFSNEIYPLDSMKHKIIGVTGTNGKSSTTFLAAQMANTLFKLNAFVLGTLGVSTSRDGFLTWQQTGFTTPPFLVIRRLLHEYFVTKNHDVCFIEVSSHGLHQQRIYKIPFWAGGWTNLTQDHLDYHKTMDEYFEAKKLFLSDYTFTSKKFYISNKQIDLFEKLASTKIGFLTLTNKKTTEEFLSNTMTPQVFHAGHNFENFDLALHLALTLGDQKEAVSFSDLRLPPGRFEHISFRDEKSQKEINVIIDFAHTADGITSILKQARQTFPNDVLVCVFGCGGNRDKTKRPLMGKAASDLSDYVVVTSDNPRFEGAQEIIDQILPAVSKDKLVFSHENRLEAINKTFNWIIINLKRNTTVVIAGKGHEDYQEINGIKHPYTDEKVVKDFFKERNKEIL